MLIPDDDDDAAAFGFSQAEIIGWDDLIKKVPHCLSFTQ